MAAVRVPYGIWWCAGGVAACAALGLFWSARSADRLRTESSGSTAPISAAPTSANENSRALEMDPEQRNFLWQIEHHGNLLSKHGFQALAKALVGRDEGAFQRHLAPGFSGLVPLNPRQVSIHSDVLRAVRQTDAGLPPKRMDGKEFMAHLLEFSRKSRHAVKAKISLMQLHPTEEGDLDKPWEGTAQLRMWGEDEPGKPVETTLYLKYRITRPTEENLRKGWLLSCAVTQTLVARSDRFLFREVARQQGLHPERLHDNWRENEHPSATGGVYLGDFNRDGIVDVLITDLNGYFLYKGLPGGKFREVTAEVGLPSVVLDRTARGLVAAFVDLDGDGWEDLILADRIFRNLKGERFQSVTQCSLRLPPDAAGVAVADFNRDGLLDLYVFRSGGGSAGSWLDGKRGDGKQNQLWRNRGNWKFEDVTSTSGTAGDSRSTFTALWLDADNDGWPDLYVPNEFGNGILYINQKNGTFQGRSLMDGPGDFGTMGATCGDVDNDGNIDLYSANMYSKAGTRVIGNVRPGTYSEPIMARMRAFVKGSELHRNLGGMRFEQKGRPWRVHDAGWAYGAALADLDNDGWLDLHATAGYISRDRDKPDG
jgi:hypothetical protein